MVTVTLLMAKNMMPLYPCLSQMALRINSRIMPKTELSYVSRGKNNGDFRNKANLACVCFVIKSE
jgi:hypothetical protein